MATSMPLSRNYGIQRFRHSVYVDYGSSNMQSQNFSLPYPYFIQVSTTTTVSLAYPPEMGGSTPDLSAFEDILKPVYPGQKIIDIKTYSEHPHPHYLLLLSSGVELVLKTSTPQPSTLLYHERHSLETEAHILCLLESSEIWCIPKLLRCEATKTSTSTPYLLRHKFKGVPLADIEGSLTTEDRRLVDRQLGIAVEQIGQHTATKFGSVYDICHGTGERTWRRAFLNMLESVLWNAENMLITIPYSEIRYQATRLDAAFDEVTEPRLSFYDIGRPSNIIVDSKTRAIVGLTDFTGVIWGDVLMADIFENPSADILAGYGLDPTQSGYAPIRLLFYSCYRNILKIVKQYYRKQQTDEELQARKAITANLAKIAAFAL
ncbi:hypothetical protein FQN57_006752 [Myotisia sp. PD_48]|nr:hypothetical protein FQN57_006752 [Myotisia sp. PD_48]